MKKIFLLALLILYGTSFISAQLKLSSGTTFKVASGAYLSVNDINNTSGTIMNAGTLHIKGDVIIDGELIIKPAIYFKSIFY